MNRFVKASAMLMRLQVPPTVCQLLHTLRVGGAEVLAARLARKQRHRVHFVFACLDELGSLGKELRDEGFRVHVLERKPGLDWACSLRLANFLRRERVDLVHAHQYTPFFYGVTARLFCHRPRVLFTEHGRHQPDYPRTKRILANRCLLFQHDRVVGVGEAVRQALIRNEGIPPRRVQVIYNGVDLAVFQNRQSRETVRRELGFKETDWVILQVARLDYLKDHATAIKAFARVTARRPDARLVLVGEGPEQDKLERLVNADGLAERIRFLGLRQDIPQLLSAADMFLLTSISEGIPVTLIEAMAAGLPIVATRVGGVPEVVEDGATGLLAGAGDHEELADKMIELMSHPDRLRDMSRKGLTRARRLFSEEEMHRGYLKLYGEMLGA